MKYPLTLLLWALPSGCATPPTVSEHPTWVDVEPILRAECTHCHGPTARQSGAAGNLVYRFDFFEMTASVCGEAAAALEPQGMARGWAALIGSAIEPAFGVGRARMPPEPAASLADWQLETLLRWSANPLRGLPGSGNGRPDIQLESASAVGDQSLTVTATISDPDGEPVVGVLKIGDVALHMDRPGSFTADLDTRAWPAGRYPVSASLCDGWDPVTYLLGNAEIQHNGPR